tara:strand:- start:103 stop:402 length:300 start_codon:yes stop_codon:yes gene_type:complete
MAYHIKHGNRYSSGNTLTDREAKTVLGCLNRLVKIANKKDTYVGQKHSIYSACEELISAIDNAGRHYVFSHGETGSRPAIYRNCFKCGKKINFMDSCRC